MGKETIEGAEKRVHPSVSDKEGHIESLKESVEAARKKPLASVDSLRKAAAAKLESANYYMGTGSRLQSYKPNTTDRKYN